ncbi:uncharacterized protein LOC132935663 isoform X2 [Metopolophium dirhodum]|uniref:uncharacterized protein LOC132935663 isoform X2 n=1 Tax=Metopolophium dirhodum TaxID=44670 RepID=UPI00298FDCA9|nr:uncharacterized protein LOC132935663 isoform X2 [Metopolophium dirhodum]
MDSLLLDVLCSKYSDSEAPISVITEILSKNDSSKFKNISDEFGKLGFTKVKDLARATLRKASSVKLSRVTLRQLYGAMKIYSERLDKFLYSAKSEHKNGNYKETQKKCKELLRHQPKDLNVILLYANSFLNCENYEECIDCLEKANEINPNCSEVLNTFALVYMKKSENDKAKEYLFKVCTLEPSSVDAWSDYADFLFETNDLITAEFAYLRILHIQPEFYKARNQYGKLLLKLNKIKEAKNQFKIGLKNVKECPEILNNLADVYYKCGKFEKSIFKYKQLLEINPNLANVYYMLGMAHIKVEEYQNASNAFKKAIALEPENISFLRKLAVTYCLLDNMDLCVKTYKKCLNIKPEDFNLNLKLALVYLNYFQNYHKAEIYLKKCIELNPDRIDLYEMIFEAYTKSNDHLNASDACMSIGDLYLEKDDQENARNAFCCAIQTCYSNKEGLF